MSHGRIGYFNAEPRLPQPFHTLQRAACERSLPSRARIHHTVSDFQTRGRQQVPQKRPPVEGEFEYPLGRRAVERAESAPSFPTYRLTAPNFPTSRLNDVGSPMVRHGSSESMFSESLNFPEDDCMLDAHASRIMRQKFLQRQKSSRSERLLLQIIKSRTEVDDEVLQSMVRCADSVFFHGRLDGRVRWKWSSPHQSQFQNEIVGTTELRRAPRGGFETRIILSEPLLQSEDFDVRLLLSTFLHELIHCYLFICCGFQAKKSGGHTEGFRMMAKMIDQWALDKGGVVLGLCDMNANLNDFRHSVPIYVGPSKNQSAVYCGESFHIIHQADMNEDDGDLKAWYIPPAVRF